LRALAGVLRLARGLRKSGIGEVAGFRAEKTAAAVLLHVPGLVDSAETAARLAAAKHLLDTYLASRSYSSLGRRHNWLRFPPHQSTNSSGRRFGLIPNVSQRNGAGW